MRYMCCIAGCNEISDRAGKCEKHRKAPRSNAELRKTYFTAAWAKTRRAVIARDNGLCRQCLARGITKAGTDVDHITKAVDRPDLFHSLDNLQLLCHECHSEKTAIGQ